HSFPTRRSSDLEELALAQRHGRARGREWVGEDVESVDTVPAVHLHVLVDNPRGEAEAPAWGDPEGGPHAAALATVDVVVDLQIGLHRVHPAAPPVAVAP